MRRSLLFVFGVAMTTGMLARSAAPVAACSCAPLEPEQTVRSLFEYYELVLAGAIADTSSEHMQIDVETVYHGPPLGRITLDQPREPGFQGDVSEVELLGADCSYTLVGQPGERYLLALNPARGEGEAYVPGGCFSWSFRLLDSEPWLNGYVPALERATGGGVAPERPSGDNDDGLPLLPIAAAGVALTAAVLLGAAFARTRHRQG